MGLVCAGSPKLCCEEDCYKNVLSKSSRTLDIYFVEGNPQQPALESPNYFHSDTLQFCDLTPIIQYFELNQGVKSHFFNNIPCSQGGYYKGEIANDYTRTGRGMQIWSNGAKYEGIWKENKAHGLGHLIHPNKDEFIGQWRNGKANGYGIGKFFRSEFPKIEYYGEWKNDCQHGHGIEIWSDGSKYMGEFYQGTKQGKGIYIWYDGGIYKGDWVMNEIHGAGEYRRKIENKTDSVRVIKCQWQNSLKHGLGCHSLGLIKYEGEFYKDKKHGFGVFNRTDGKKFAGYWKNGLQHGYGILFAAAETEQTSTSWYINQKKIKKGVWNNGIREKTDGKSDKSTSLCITDNRTQHSDNENKPEINLIQKKLNN